MKLLQGLVIIDEELFAFQQISRYKFKGTAIRTNVFLTLYKRFEFALILAMEKTNSVYLIRHGQSKLNQILNEIPPGDIEYRFRKDLIDCELTELGVKQAKAAGELLKDVNITLVLVSPLRRALQTAYYAFKDHPSKPGFKVIPIGREVLGACSHFPSDIEILQKEFPFDFSGLEALKDKRYWIIETLEGKAKKLVEDLAYNLPDSPEKYDKFLDALLATARELYPNNIESSEDFISRGKKLKNVLRNHLGLMKATEKLAYVGHEMMSLVMTATKFDEKMYALDGIRLKNAEVKEYCITEETNDKE